MAMATLAELLEHYDRLIVEIAESGGETSVSVDGTSFTTDRGRQLALLKAEIDRLQANSGSVLSLMGHVKLVSQGAG